MRKFLEDGPRGRFIGLGAAVLLLTGCVHQLDEVRIFVAEDASGTLVASGHSKNTNTDPNSSSQKKLREFKDDLEECGLNVSSHQGSQRLSLEITSEFSTPDLLVSSLRCAFSSWDGFDISIAKESGVLYDTRLTTVEMSRPTFAEMVDYTGRTPDFPKEFFLTIPGEIDTYTLDGSAVGVDAQIEKISENQIRATFERDREEGGAYLELKQRMDAELEARFAGMSEEEVKRVIQAEIAEYSTDVISIAVESKTARFSLNEIIAVLGVIFGSGLALELARRVFRVRVVDNDDPDAEESS